MREEKNTKEGQCCNYDHVYNKRKEEMEILRQPPQIMSSKVSALKKKAYCNE